MEDFIGSQFQTGKGHTLTVVAPSSTRGKFILECSGCSVDEDLWPYGRITSSKNNLKSGRTPCGCSRNPSWTEDQIRVLINRRCKIMNYQFEGFCGKYIGIKTKIKIRNLQTGKSWNTSRVATFLNGSKDPRVQGNYRFSEKERLSQINEELYNRGGKFISWVDGYKNSSSKFLWKCNSDHQASNAITNFLHGGKGCITCALQGQKDGGIGYGFYPKRVGEVDNLYVIHFKKDNVLKVGRSFDIRKRLRVHNGLLRKSNHSISDIEILEVFKGVHKDVFYVEQELHRYLRREGYHEVVDWTSESFCLGCLDIVQDFLENSSLDNITTPFKENFKTRTKR